MLFDLEDILCFYALEYKCQLHPYLSVALAVSSQAPSMLSRHGLIAKCLGAAMCCGAYDYGLS